LWFSAVEGNSVDIAATATAKRPKQVPSRNPRGDQIHNHTATAAARRKHVDLFGRGRHTHSYQLMQNFDVPKQTVTLSCLGPGLTGREHGRLNRVFVVAAEQERDCHVSFRDAQE
jgi:hypothetical protein